MLFFVECISTILSVNVSTFDVDSIVDDTDRKFLTCCFP